MPAKDLNNQEMISVSASWLDGNGWVFVGDNAPLKQLYPRLQKAHSRLVEFDKRSSDFKREDRALTDTIATQNKAYDHLVCGVYWALIAGRYLELDPEAAKMYAQVSAGILPNGRSVVRSTFRNQAGAAIYAQEYLTPECVEFLSKVVYGDRTLYEAVVDMVEMAKKLAGSLDKRSQLSIRNSESFRRQEDREARNQWIEIATHILSMAEMIGMSADDMNRLRANYDDADAVAVRRRKSKVASAKKKKEEEAKRNKEAGIIEVPKEKIKKTSTANKTEEEEIIPDEPEITGETTDDPDDSVPTLPDPTPEAEIVVDEDAVET